VIDQGVAVVEDGSGPVPPVLVLVGVTEGSDLPAGVVERVGAAAAAARRAGIRVVHLGPASGKHGEVIVHPLVGRRADDLTLALAPGDDLGTGRIDAIVGDAGSVVLAGSVALAGPGRGGLLVQLAGQAAARNLAVSILGDACGGPRVTDHADPQVTDAMQAINTWALGPVLASETWVRSIRPRRSRRRVVSAVSFTLAAMMVVTGLVVAHNQARDYYLLSPGSAPMLTASATCRPRTSGSINLSLADGRPCARLSVPPARDHGLSGGLYMVDVLEGPATATDYLLDRFGLLKTFHEGSQLLPASAILGSTPPPPHPCQNTQQMLQATTDAPVAALRRLNYDVAEQDLGAQMDLVMPGFPAALAGLACNDVITSIDGNPVRTSQDVSALLSGAKPGTTVDIGVSSPGTRGAPSHRTVAVTLSAAPPEAGPTARPAKGFLGVQLETRSSYTLPFNVTIDVGDIGGPSAGLALALGLVDLLSNGHLLGSHKVAATGTISPNGTVGPIGGLDQKAVAVRRAGARVFFVPAPASVQDQAELKAARQEAGSGLKIYPVRSLQDALGIMAGLGGTVPPAPAATPPPTSAPGVPAPGG